MNEQAKLAAKPILLLLFGAFVTAFGPSLVRISSLEPTATAFWRMALAFPLLSLVAMGRAKAEPSSQFSLGRLYLFAGAAFAFDLACWHTSIRLTTIANASLFANTAPLLVALVSWLFFGERFRSGFWWGLLLALAGATALVGHGFQIDPERFRGDLLGLATAVFYAGYLFGVSRLRSREGAWRVMAGVTGVSAAIVGFLAWCLGESFWPKDPSGWWPLLGLALGPQVLGQGCIAYALAFLPPAFASVNLLFQPVVAAIIAWSFLGETLGGLEILGVIAVLCGIAVANRARQSG